MSISYGVVFSGIFGSGTFRTFLSEVTTLSTSFLAEWLFFVVFFGLLESELPLSELPLSELLASLESLFASLAELLPLPESPLLPKGTSSRFISGHGLLEFVLVMPSSGFLVKP